MRKLLVLSCLFATAFAGADDPSMRAEFQGKYDAVDASINGGDMHAIAPLCDSGRFVALNIQKQRQTLDQVFAGLDQKKGLQIKTVVESADTLDTMAKTALRITSTQIVTEKGKQVTYKTVRTEEDTWMLEGTDWKLVQTRLTSNTVARDGKVIASESEHVLTDWDRHYGHQSSRRHHG
jgi:hypothetical protein